MIEISAFFFNHISLNQEKRRKELLRVSKENATLAKRIIERKPDTNRDSWKYSWSKNTSYLENISKFGSDWHLSSVRRNVLLTIKEFSLYFIF
jgi:hypothetical protein